MQLLLSSVWIGQNPSGWWMSEKFDGVRAYWDGFRLWSRNGNEFHPPAWWAAKLPAIPFDGELWFGRGGYLRVMGEVKRNVPDNAAWKQITFQVFDCPAHNGPFEARQNYIADGGASSPIFFCLLPPMHFSKLVTPAFHVGQTKCKGLSHMIKMLREVHALGGEGLMLRAPGSLYEHGRSETLLKVRCANNSELLHD